MFDAELKEEISNLAEMFSIEPAALLAIVEVESGGKLGARVEGRFEPLIRFEGHYFYRLLPHAKRNRALAQGLASPKAGRVKNPVRQVTRWKLLKRAEAIDRSAALSSCSWGCGQVMGSHWRWLGYGSVDALVVEARSGTEGQVRLMMRFIKKAGLLGKLQEYDWAGFARAYNGPAYRRNKYDVKMRKAYERYSGGKPLRTQRHGFQYLRMGSVGNAVKTLQRSLRALGFTLRVDGDFGPATERMVKLFQRENRLKADGIYGPKTAEKLLRKIPIAAIA